MIDLSNYSIERIYCHDDRVKLCVGVIVECENNHNYGIIYQYNDESYSSEFKRGGLYFFNKDKHLEIPQYTLVSFLKDIQNSFKSNYEVTDVCILSEFINYVLTTSKDKESYYESLSTESMEHLIKNGRKFLVVDYDDEEQYVSSGLYYPVINNDNQRIEYYNFNSSCHSCPESIFNCYCFKIAIEDYMQFANISSRIKQILEYLTPLNLDDILGLYSVLDRGYYQRRVGRDDHFIFEKTKSCSSNDPYLEQLTKLGTIVTDYYSCQGRDDEDFSNINLEETAHLQLEIRDKYNKSEHLLFLINDYLNMFDTLKTNLKHADDLINDLIKRAHDIFHTHQCNNIEQWKDVILKNNRK
jgi:hypothetical protein